MLNIEDPEIAAIHERDWDIILWTNNTIETDFGFIHLQQFFGENNYAFVVNYYDGKMYWKEVECIKTVKIKYGVDRVSQIEKRLDEVETSLERIEVLNPKRIRIS